MSKTARTKSKRRLKSEDDSKFGTFATVQTDATGNYSLKVKVRSPDAVLRRDLGREGDHTPDEPAVHREARVVRRKSKSR